MKKKKKKGFTIIEVVLVLAIAGLIFLMVFIALPALQRSQRNTRRRQDMARILSAFNDFQANNNGKVPTSAQADDFLDRYVGADGSDQRKDPDGTDYSLNFIGHIGTASGDKADGSWYDGTTGNTAPSAPTDTHKIYYFTNAKCNTSEGKVAKGSGENEIAIFYYLEGGAIYCGDNS